jgi:hypothetical protein
MGPLCASSALDFHCRFSKLAVYVASLLILLLAVPPRAFARAKPLDASAVHSRILKRGLGNPVGVEMSNGVALIGRIIAINTDSFTLQLFNDPDPVTINYADVIDLRTGPSHGFWIVTAVGIGATAGLAIWGFHHVHSLEQQNQIPNMPPFPTIP